MAVKGEKSKEKIKKQSRSLTRSEITLITAFIVLGGLYLSDKYVFAPKKEEISKVQETLEIRTQHYNALLADYNKMDELKRRIEDLKNRLLSMKMQLKSYISQEDIVLNLDKLSKDCKITLSNISLSTIQSLSLNEFNAQDNKATEAEENKSEAPVPETTNKQSDISKEDMVLTKAVQLNFEGSVKNVYDFLSQLEKNMDKIHITDISLTETIKRNEKKLSGSITVAYLAYAGKDDKEKYTLEVPPSEAKPNLFYEEGWGNDNINKDTYYSNFVLNLPSDKNDIVTFGKTYSEASKIFTESNGLAIDANFKIENVNGKYKCYYSLDKINTTLTESLVLKDDKIILLVKSHKANENTTKINLNIQNSTDKKVEVKIVDDDPKNPLITVKDRKGEITVK